MHRRIPDEMRTAELTSRVYTSRTGLLRGTMQSVEGTRAKHRSPNRMLLPHHERGRPNEKERHPNEPADVPEICRILWELSTEIPQHLPMAKNSILFNQGKMLAKILPRCKENWNLVI